MKKLLLIFLILVVTSIGWAYTETFYVCDGGNGTLPETNACATAYDADDFNTSGNWDTDDQNDGKIGPNDLVEFMDDGGDFRSIFKIQQSGLSGKPITLKAQSGDTPVIRGSDTLSSGSWALAPGVNAADKVYRATVTSRDYSFGILFDGQSKRAAYNGSSPCGYPPSGDCSSWGDGFFWGVTNNQYVYVRSVSAPPGDSEIGVRPYGIVGNGKDYITIDGLTVYGPFGIDTDTWDDYTDDCDVTNVGCVGGSKKRGPLSFRNCDYIIVQNCTVKYGNSVGIGFWEGGSNGQILDNEVSEFWGGLWLNYVGDVWEMSRNHITQISTVNRSIDLGDRDLIGTYYAGQMTIQDNYLDTNGYAGLSNGNGITMSQNDGGPNVIRRNYIKNTGSSGILVGENGIGTSIYNNIIDGWGALLTDGDSHWGEGIIVGGGGDGAGAYDTIILNNLFVNGPSYYQTKSGRTIRNAAIHIEANTFDDITVKNNLITGNNTYYALAYDTSSAIGTTDISYNYFDERADRAIGIKVGWSGEDYWLYNELNTWESEESGNASNNYNWDDERVEPYLTTTAAGTVTVSGSTPSTIMGTWGDDLADAAVDIAVASNRTWTPYASMDHLTITRGTTYAIGPYETGTAIYPSNRLPVDGAQDINQEKDITWTNPGAAITIDVRFACGDETPPIVLDDEATSTESYDPGTLGDLTTCYWSIDVNHAGGTETGVIWSFKTASGPEPVVPTESKGRVKFNSAAGRMKYDADAGRAR